MSSIEVREEEEEREAGNHWGITIGGPHILFISLCSMPVALTLSSCVTFYFAIWTWYNIYLYFSNEKTIWHKVTVCPFLVLSFPLCVSIFSLAVGLYASVVQVSWHADKWLQEIQFFEKHSCLKLCSKLGLVGCCPYDLEIITDEAELEPMKS